MLPHKPRLNPLRFGVVVLAAGRGARMGGRAKCLLQRDDKPLLHWQLSALLSDGLRACGVSRVVVVLGHYAEHILPVLSNFSVVTVCQPASDHSMAASIDLGLQALSVGGTGGDASGLSSELDAVLVCPADLPLLAVQDYAQAINAFQCRPRGSHLMYPCVDGVPGHPVIFDRVVCDTIFNAAQAMSPRQWRKHHPAHVHAWATDNANYVWDVDSLADIAALASATGVALKLPARE